MPVIQESNNEDPRLQSISKMLDLLKCVSCLELPFDKVFTPAECCHKYCVDCMQKLSLKECIICQITINHKNREVDWFSTNLLTNLFELQRQVESRLKSNTALKPLEPVDTNESESIVEILSDDDEEESTLKHVNEVPTLILPRSNSNPMKNVQQKDTSEENKKPSLKTFTRKRRIPSNSSPAASNSKPSSSSRISKTEDKSNKKQLSSPRDSRKKDDSAVLATAEEIVKLFNSSGSENEDNDPPALTPQPKKDQNQQKFAVKSLSSSAITREKPMLEVQVQIEKLASPTTRSRSKLPVESRNRRSLEQEFKAEEKSSSKINKIDDASEEFARPKPKKEKKFFRLRRRSKSGSSSAEDEPPSRLSFLGRRKSRKSVITASTFDVKQKQKPGESTADEKSDQDDRQQKKSKNARSVSRSVSPAADKEEDVYDFQSQSKKVDKKKNKKKVKLLHIDSDSSNASSVSSVKQKIKNIFVEPKSAIRGSRQSSVSSNVSVKKSPSVNAIRKKNAKGETGLHIAVRSGKLEKARELIEAGAEIDAKDYAGWAPLHEAINAKVTSMEMIKLLCESGADVNAPGMNDETPLHESARLDLLDVTLYLLQNNASPAIRNAHGKLPKTYARTDAMKQIFVDYEEQSKNQTQSNDLSIELKVSLQKAVYYFAYDVPKNVLKESKVILDMKISTELNQKVTHVFFDAKPKSKIPLTIDFLIAILNGCWILSSKWIEDSLSVKRFLDPRKYQLAGCVFDDIPSSTGEPIAVERARQRREHGHPSLFHGMNFYIYKNTGWPPNVKGGKSTISLNKKDIGKLIQFGDGVVVNREPNPEMVDPLETPERYHARQDSQLLLSCDSSSSLQDHKLTLTSHIILYDDKNSPPVKHDLEHVKTLKIDWLIHSAVHFRLLHPDSYL